MTSGQRLLHVSPHNLCFQSKMEIKSLTEYEYDKKKSDFISRFKSKNGVLIHFHIRYM